MKRPPPLHVEVTITVHQEVLERYKTPSYGDTAEMSLYPYRHTDGTGTLSRSQMKLLEGQLANVEDFLTENDCYADYVQRIWSGRSLLRGAQCNYCRGALRVSVTVLLRRVIYYEAPPPGAKDLRKVLSDKWIIQRRDVSGACSGPGGRTFAKCYESDI